VLALSIVANGLTKPLAHDEQMYCAGAVLLSRGEMIYRDFSYVAQMPYHPLLCAALFRLLGTTHYLLAARMLSCACDIMVVVFIIQIFRGVLGDRPAAAATAGAAAAVLYALNPAVVYAGGFAWNHDVVVFCVVFALRLVVLGGTAGGRRIFFTAFAGLLLTFATFTRITTALPLLLFAVVLWAAESGSVKQRFVRNVLPFAAGSLAALVWPLAVILSAPRAFFLNAFRIPLLNSRFLHGAGMTHDKLDVIAAYATTLPYLALLGAAAYLWLKAAVSRRPLRPAGGAVLWLAALLPAVFVVIALIPPTMWRQYMALPVPFLAIGLVVPLYLLGRSQGGFTLCCTVVVFCAAVAVVGNLAAVERIAALGRPDTWVPLRVHAVAADIAAGRRAEGPILTLAPLYALEGGCDIYTELSAGPFVYRVGGLLGAGDLETVRAASAETMQRVVQNRPPAAVVLGAEPAFLEDGLFRSAVGDGWSRRDYPGGIAAFFAPPRPGN
jgi:4-amino-4-deoxy-L-arabinose transferase-like glycosyltransferase